MTLKPGRITSKFCRNAQANDVVLLPRQRTV